jgi:hypothetical protein
MKSRNKIFTSNADSDKYTQACSACTYFRFIRQKENSNPFETRQLYATEAEDYFFYFITAERKDVLSIAV